jgi:hypothetical protein
MTDKKQEEEDNKKRQQQKDQGMLVPYSASGFCQGSSTGVSSWLTRPTDDVAIDSEKDEGMNHARPILYIS